MRKINYIAVDNLSAISSYGEEFNIGEIVRHEDAEAGTAMITRFSVDEDLCEVLVNTDKGCAHLDFLIKIK